MKKQSSFQQTPPFDLRPASVEEAGLFYSNDERDEALGTVGHLRMDFGSGGKGFYHTWWPHNGDHFNTPEFKEALQEFVDAMRQSGPLKNLAAMNTYCWHNGGEISENDRVYIAALRRSCAYRRSAQAQNIRQRGAAPDGGRWSIVPRSFSMTTLASPSADFLML